MRTGPIEKIIFNQNIRRFDDDESCTPSVQEGRIPQCKVIMLEVIHAAKAQGANPDPIVTCQTDRKVFHEHV